MAPAALPSAPVGSSAPVPSVSWGATPGADTTTPPAEEKPQSPFYFTRFTWGNQASTQLFGVGGENYLSSDAQYIMNFALNVRYYFLNRPLDKAYVNVNASFEVELTDTPSTSTTTAHQPLLNDTVVGIGYGHTVYQSVDKQWKTTPGISGSFVLPTSLASLDQGKYLSTAINANLIQAVPLAGNKSDWFSDLLVFGIVGYTHTFSQCTTACNGGAPTNVIRQVGQVGTPSGQDVSSIDVHSDQLAAGRLALDKVKFNGTYFLTLYKDLSLANTWEISLPLKPDLPVTTVTNPPTGPATLTSSPAPVNPVTTFDVSLAYLLFNTARIDIGYQSVSPELTTGNAGQRVSVFWTPEAVFYGNVSIYIDSLIDKAINPPTKQQALSGGRFHLQN